MYGETVTALPEGFETYQQLPECRFYLNIPAGLNPELVGRAPLGERWRLGPLVIERYVGDREPDLELSARQGRAGARLVLWQRLVRDGAPAGWRQFSHNMSRLEGFFELQPGEPYERRWSQSARRYRKQWQERPAHYALEQVGIDEFARAYRGSPAYRKTGGALLRMLERKVAAGVAERLNAVRDSKSGALVAGLAVVDSPSHRGSYYECGFAAHDAPAHAMVGLMDDWFARSAAHGIRFLHFGGFWFPGKPRSWKGFSAFKAKFGLRYIACKPTLVRWVW